MIAKEKEKEPETLIQATIIYCQKMCNADNKKVGIEKQQRE